MATLVNKLNREVKVIIPNMREFRTFYSDNEGVIGMFFKRDWEEEKQDSHWKPSEEQPDNEDIDKVAQELYEHLYELKRRNNVPTNLYDKQEIIDLWKAGIVYGRSHPKQEQPDFPTTDEEIERLLATHPKVEVPDKYKTPDWLWKKQEQPEVECEDLEEVARAYSEQVTDGHNYRDLTCGFKAGAEWGEKNAYKAIMKKADEVRDKKFDTDYEVKIEPAAGFDLGCVNVYREGKLVGQYVEPKEEKKLPEDLEEAAKKYDEAESWRYEALKYPRREAFEAGAKWQKEQTKKGNPIVMSVEDFQALIDNTIKRAEKEAREQMMKEGLKGEVCGRVKDHINVRFPDGLCKYLKPENISHIPADVTKYNVGDKVRVIIVKEEEQ